MFSCQALFLQNNLRMLCETSSKLWINHRCSSFVQASESGKLPYRRLEIQNGGLHSRTKFVAKNAFSLCVAIHTPQLGSTRFLLRDPSSDTMLWHLIAKTSPLFHLVTWEAFAIAMHRVCFQPESTGLQRTLY